MSTKTLVVLGAGLVAIVLLALLADPSAREWAIAAIATLVTLILRAGDHAVRGGGATPPTILALLLTVPIMSCSGGEVRDSAVYAGHVTVEAGDATEIEAAGSVEWGMIRGDTLVDVYHDDQVTMVSTSVSVQVLGQLLATVSLSCDHTGWCEICLSRKMSLCHEWTDNESR